MKTEVEYQSILHGSYNQLESSFLSWEDTEKLPPEVQRGKCLLPTPEKSLHGDNVVQASTQPHICQATNGRTVVLFSARKDS